MTKMVNLNVRLDESEHQKLVQTCTGRGCDKSTVVREALRAYMGSAQPTGPALVAAKPAQRGAWNIDEPAIPGFIDSPRCPVSGLPFVRGRLLSKEEEALIQ